MVEFDGVISVTSYPGPAQSVCDAPGWISVVHCGNAGDPDVHVSFDGTTKSLTLIPGATWTSPTSSVPPSVWFKLSTAGSARVTMTRIRWDEFR